MTNQVDIPAHGRKNAKCGSLEALCLFVSPARGQQPKKKSFSPIRLSDSRLSAQTPRKVHVDRIMDFTSKPFIIYSHLIHFLFICWQPRRPWGACFFYDAHKVCVCFPVLCVSFPFPLRPDRHKGQSASLAPPKCQSADLYGSSGPTTLQHFPSHYPTCLFKISKMHNRLTFVHWRIFFSMDFFRWTTLKWMKI